MNQDAFEELRSIVYDQSGIRIQDGKETMVAARLAQRLRKLNLKDEEAYLSYLRGDLEREIVELLDVISTNVTHFFRESDHFDYVAGFMKAWLDEGQERFRFWSAASSTGEEPYSLAMTIDELMSKHGRPLDVRILATDISTRVLGLAENGVFASSKLDDVPQRVRSRYFESVEGSDGELRAKKCLRDLILFKRVNLSKPPFPMKGPMDVIFCRNVMIYFDNPVRTRLTAEFHKLLRPGGYLIVGKSESLVNHKELFERGGPSIYRKGE